MRLRQLVPEIDCAAKEQIENIKQPASSNSDLSPFQSGSLWKFLGCFPTSVLLIWFNSREPDGRHLVLGLKLVLFGNPRMVLLGEDSRKQFECRAGMI